MWECPPLGVLAPLMRRLYIPLGGVPLRDVNTSTSLRAPSRLAYGQSKLSIVGVSPARNPCHADGSVSSSVPDACTSRCGSVTHSKAVTQAPAYGPLSISLQAVKILHCGSVSTWSHYSIAGISFFSEPPKFAGIVMGLPSLGDNITDSPRHSTTNRPYRRKKSKAQRGIAVPDPNRVRP